MKQCYLIIILLVAVSLSFTSVSECATFYYDTGLSAEHRNYETYKDVEAQVVGHNTTHGITKNLTYYFGMYTSNGTKWRLYYIVPDDGSKWNVAGTIYVRKNEGEFNGSTDWTTIKQVLSETFERTHTTLGTYTGPSIKAATDAANEAKNSAIAAKSSADTAKTEATNAKNAANAANTNAANAYSSAQSAANTVINGYGGNGKSLSATYDVAAVARDNATYIRNTQLPEVRNVISNLETTINNMATGDTTPPTVKVCIVSGAKATSGISIDAIVSVSDNQPGPFDYSVNSGSYTELPSDGLVTLPVPSYGNNAITVRVKDTTGNIGMDTIIIRRL